MISVNEAKSIVSDNATLLPASTVPLQDSVGLVSAETILSPIDFPAFDQSNMDGYAFHTDDYAPGKPLHIAGSIAAGSSIRSAISRGEAMRIFTGSAIPQNADIVIMQEKARVEKSNLFVEEEQVIRNTNIRPTGSDIRAGSIALETGTLMSSAAIGFLAALGITEIQCIRRPRIYILITGNEIQQPGSPLQFGKVYDANSKMLQSALKAMHVSDITIAFVPDDLGQVGNALKKALLASDLVLLTGGVSVGDYDFVLKAANNTGVETLFHRVKQKPGKPLFFGKAENKLVFGLPGNPSSVLTCFYEYVVPALERMMARKNLLQTTQLKMVSPFEKKKGLTHFLKARKENDKVYPLDGQESFRLNSFAKADCLICLPEDLELCNPGDLVEVHMLP
ncbi:MAG: gephyrin-like molybdotransferase Glp [Chitinophagales bacterium]